MTHDRIDQAAAVVSSAMHQGDGGNQARELLSFEAQTMGRAEYNAMVEQVQMTEALNINDLMRNGKHDEALSLLREDANIFLNHDDFMELAGEVRAMNKATRSPSHLEFNPIYQNGDQYGRPTAVEVDMATTFQNPTTGQQWEKRDVVTRVDNRLGSGEIQVVAPPQVVVIQQPPQVIIDDRQRGGFTFNLEIEIGRERVRRHDPRWCPDREWRPSNAPPGFNLEIEIGRTREDYRRRGDHDWNPRRPTNQTIINQINNTTIINNNTKIDSHDKNTTIDRSRTRVTETPPGQQPRRDGSHPQRTEVPAGQQRRDGQPQRTEVPPAGQQRRDGQPQRTEVPPAQQRREAPTRPEAQTPEQRRDAAQQRREDAQGRQGNDRTPPPKRGEQVHPRDNDKDEKEKREKKKN